MKPTISIITPVYNAEKYIKRCVDSIIMQSFYDWELILINDGSTDSSLQMLRQYEDNENIRIIDLPQNGGVSNARNIGIQRAQGDFITFVDIDDYLETDYLNNFVQSDLSASSCKIQGAKIIDENNYKLSGEIKFDDIVCNTLNSSELWGGVFAAPWIHMG